MQQNALGLSVSYSSGEVVEESDISRHRGFNVLECSFADF